MEIIRRVFFEAFGSRIGLLLQDKQKGKREEIIGLLEKLVIEQDSLSCSLLTEERISVVLFFPGSQQEILKISDIGSKKVLFSQT